MNIIDSDGMLEIRERLYDLLPKIRKNAVALVDAFDWKDSHLSNYKIYFVTLSTNLGIYLKLYF